VKLLDGPHRLNALVVLGERAAELSPDQRERSWRAAAQSAKEMTNGIEHGKPPSSYDVRKLSGSVSLLWVKLDSDPAKRLTDLATMRNVVHAAGDETQKAVFAWADRILAAPAGPY
jgi:hypothetical protein